jgi:hypothetical protein
MTGRRLQMTAVSILIVGLITAVGITCPRARPTT